jgi:protein involved in polysaccharide export with SLBB domain
MVLTLGLLAPAGCSSAPGTSFFPSGQTMQRTTRDLRQQYPWPLPRELAKEPLALYVVEPGDVLLIQPADLDSPVRIPGDQPVLPDGTIQLGRYGLVLVAGKSLPEIEAIVREAVAAQTKDAGPITVRLVTRASKVYYVLGEVNAPGAYPLQGRETALDGILAAGGLNDRASRKQIVLTRPTPPDSCRLVLPIGYNEIVQQGDTTTNYQLAPGDRIYVPSRCMLDDLHALFEKQPCPPHPCPMP